jgi:hypothetical protein
MQNRIPLVQGMPSHYFAFVNKAMAVEECDATAAAKCVSVRAINIFIANKINICVV